ncbi:MULTISPECIES: AzlD domain-containing protein [Fibrobacter]|uniref:Branched-chain amino acid transport protein n=2 Tax=Fibrobacter TaxID=832 RepID=A0A1T4QGE0_9BACT|nr:MULTISPECIES: AzlD domain-containing protein [Fibrobacter]MDD7298367.1 AzlD domain-containing protein [Fibrobacter intestinalis]PBC72961.1 branched-subunit amino acid transport protein [Fibrobacter sp. NR9]SKA02706.1 Branched-chain amino acid transport protein [Fibrobacter intestinalis]
MNWRDFFLYLLTMAGVTYLLRTIPFILLRKQLKSEFWNSFLSYIPFTVLAAMTVPAMFYATDNRLSGIAAFFAAAAAAILGRGLVIVACAATAAVLFMDGVIL